VQKKILDLEGERNYSFRTSAKSKPIYDFDHHDREAEKVTAVYQELIVAVIFLN
jgi:hypothetical protein